MKQVGYILASCMIVAGSMQATNDFSDDVSIKLAGCPCNKRRLPPPKPQAENEDDVTFMLADCPCKNKNRQAPQKPAAPTIQLAGCGCQKNKPNQERVERKPMPLKEKKDVYSLMAKMGEQNKKLAGANRTTLHQKGIFSFFKASPFPVVTHFVRETDSKGSIITIQDGSVWAVSENDRDIAKSWRVHDEITIKPNSLTLWQKLTRKQKMHEYRLMNIATNQSVAVNMSSGPFKYNPNRRQISSIDAIRGEVYLSDNSLWKIELSDPARQLLRGWKKGHTLICGTNDTWFSLGSPFILISVDVDNWIPATRIN